MVQEKQWRGLADLCFWRPNLPGPFLEGLERQFLALVEFYHSADLLTPDNVWGTDHSNICRRRENKHAGKRARATLTYQASWTLK